MSFKIIISTCAVLKLWLAGLEKGFFTHIFIDEAAQVNYAHMSRPHTLSFHLTYIQALETEANIALCLADEKTKVVLAGDHMQVCVYTHSLYFTLHSPRARGV